MNRKRVVIGVFVLMIILMSVGSVFGETKYTGQSWHGDKADFSKLPKDMPASFMVQSKYAYRTSDPTRTFAFIPIEEDRQKPVNQQKGKLVQLTSTGYEMWGEKIIPSSKVRDQLMTGNLAGGWGKADEAHKYETDSVRIVFPDGRSSQPIFKREMKPEDTRKYLDSVLGFSDSKYRIDTKKVYDGKASLASQVEVPGLQGGKAGLYDVGATYKTGTNRQYTVQSDGSLVDQLTGKKVGTATNVDKTLVSGTASTPVVPPNPIRNTIPITINSGGEDVIVYVNKAEYEEYKDGKKPALPVYVSQYSTSREPNMWISKIKGKEGDVVTLLEGGRGTSTAINLEDSGAVVDLTPQIEAITFRGSDGKDVTNYRKKGSNLLYEDSSLKQVSSASLDGDTVSFGAESSLVGGTVGKVTLAPTNMKRIELLENGVKVVRYYDAVELEERMKASSVDNPPPETSLLELYKDPNKKNLDGKRYVPLIGTNKNMVFVDDGNPETFDGTHIFPHYRDSATDVKREVASITFTAGGKEHTRYYYVDELKAAEESGLSYAAVDVYESKAMNDEKPKTMKLDKTIFVSNLGVSTQAKVTKKISVPSSASAVLAKIKADGEVEVRVATARPGDQINLLGTQHRASDLPIEVLVQHRELSANTKDRRANAVEIAKLKEQQAKLGLADEDGRRELAIKIREKQAVGKDLDKKRELIESKIRAEMGTEIVKMSVVDYSGLTDEQRMQKRTKDQQIKELDNAVTAAKKKFDDFPEGTSFIKLEEARLDFLAAKEARDKVLKASVPAKVPTTGTPAAGKPGAKPTAKPTNPVDLLENKKAVEALAEFGINKKVLNAMLALPPEQRGHVFESLVATEHRVQAWRLIKGLGGKGLDVDSAAVKALLGTAGNIQGVGNIDQTEIKVDKKTRKVFLVRQVGDEYVDIEIGTSNAAGTSIKLKDGGVLEAVNGMAVITNKQGEIIQIGGENVRDPNAATLRAMVSDLKRDKKGVYYLDDGKRKVPIKLTSKNGIISIGSIGGGLTISRVTNDEYVTTKIKNTEIGTEDITIRWREGTEMSEAYFKGEKAGEDGEASFTYIAEGVNIPVQGVNENGIQALKMNQKVATARRLGHDSSGTLTVDKNGVVTGETPSPYLPMLYQNNAKVTVDSDGMGTAIFGDGSGKAFLNDGTEIHFTGTGWDRFSDLAKQETLTTEQKTALTNLIDNPSDEHKKALEASGIDPDTIKGYSPVAEDVAKLLKENGLRRIIGTGTVVDSIGRVRQIQRKGEDPIIIDYGKVTKNKKGEPIYSNKGTFTHKFKDYVYKDGKIFTMEGTRLVEAKGEDIEAIKEQIKKGEAEKREVDQANAKFNENSRLGYQTLTQKFFKGLSVMSADAKSFSGLSSLFMDQEAMAEWRENVDGVFAKLNLGTIYWASKICQAKLDVESGTQVAFTFGPNPYDQPTPAGSVSVAATCSGEKQIVNIGSDLMEDNILYKITWYVRNPSDNDMQYNVILSPGGTPIFTEDQTIGASGSAVKTGRSAYVTYSSNDYTECCVEMTNGPPLAAGSNPVCNAIVAVDTTPTKTSSPPAGDGAQTASGGAAPAGPQYNTI